MTKKLKVMLDGFAGLGALGGTIVGLRIGLSQNTKFSTSQTSALENKKTNSCW